MLMIKDVCLIGLIVCAVSCQSSSFQQVGSASQAEPQAGEEVADLRLGIGYEDWTDMDYNDSVVCFAGKFLFDKNKGVIRSMSEQSINVFIKRNSAGQQHISLSLKADGQGQERKQFSVDNLGREEERSFKVKFNVNDHLIVKMHHSNGRDKVFLPFPANVSKYDRLIIEKNKCRTTGQ